MGGLEGEDKAESGDMELNRTLLNRFDLAAILDFIVAEKARGKNYREEIVDILKVLYIVKKVEDYGHARKAVAEKDKDNINKEELDKSNRALSLRGELVLVASK